MMTFGTPEGIEALVPVFVDRVERGVHTERLSVPTHLMAAAGQMSAAHELLMAMTASRPAAALVFRAQFAVLPFVPAHASELQTIRQLLIDWDAQVTLPRGSPTPDFVVDSLAPHIRLYLLGLVALRLDNEREAMQRVVELQQLGMTRAQREVAEDFASSLRAYSAVSKGDAGAALRWLDSSDREAHARRYLQPYAMLSYSMFAPPLLDRFLRADALLQLGRLDEAYRWFHGFTEQGCVPCLPYFAVTHAKRAHISEQRGDYARAAEHYAYVLALLRDADPVYAELRDTASRGLSRLRKSAM